MTSAPEIVTVDDCGSPRRVPSAKVPRPAGSRSQRRARCGRNGCGHCAFVAELPQVDDLSRPVRPFVRCSGLQYSAEANEQVQVEVLTFERDTFLWY